MNNGKTGTQGCCFLNLGVAMLKGGVGIILIPDTFGL